MTSPAVDPVYAHSKSEAKVILVIWGLSFLWTVPYCYFAGYQTPQAPIELSLTFGIPSWVFWGVAFPWTVSGLLSIILCLFYIKDDDLGQAEDELPLADETH